MRRVLLASSKVFSRLRGKLLRPPVPQRGSRAPSGKPVYTRSQITEMARRRQKGLIGDDQWRRWEYELCLASKEGRVVGALSLADGIPVSR